KMRATYYVLLIAALSSYAASNQVVQLNDKLDTVAGNSVTFECSLKDGSMGSYYMFWYRQRPKNSLEWIYKEGGKYGDRFGDRFVGTVDGSNNKCTLEINAAELGDAAVYYCAASP
uniref:Ig-like domain-containing protein n=1 Tax=Latimeria chalumnae TaxID=7897 RepID=H3AMS3_LATCH